jgi:fermentation-respiration switch protein FrsA (DUF1100 family)
MRHATLVMLAVGLSCGAMGCFNVDFMFFPGLALDEYTLPDNHIPEDQLEQVSYDTDAGETIYGYWAFSDQWGLGVEPEDVVLYCHGNHHNIDHYWPRVQLLWDEGYTVFTFDYPGYGMSTGETTEDGLYRSAVGAHAEVIGRLGGDPDGMNQAAGLRVVYYGFSLGAGPAIYLAAEHDEPAALATEAAMANGQAFVEDSTGTSLPSSVLTTLELDNIGRIPRVDAPKLFMHGVQDDYIRAEFSELLYDAADTPKQLWLAPNADHGDVVCDGATHDCADAPDEAFDAWRGVFNDFVDEALPGI